jgi:hypothetical protein
VQWATRFRAGVLGWEVRYSKHTQVTQSGRTRTLREERPDHEQDISKKEKNQEKEEHKAVHDGEINMLIDGLAHPLAQKDKRFILIDGFLHALNERDPPQSLRKFLKYNLPEIIRQMEKSSRTEA